MLLCLDIGNSQIFGGVYDGEDLKTTFRRTSSVRASSDEYGIFFRNVLREKDIDPRCIEMGSICSVVPDVLHSLRSCFQKYFGFDPFFLQPGAKTGLKIRYRNPLEVGADKIANAIGALALFPGRNLLIVDFGTATTLCAVNKEKEYLGGIIMPGIQMSMAALDSRTARLPAVEIVRPAEVLGRSTVESIQSGSITARRRPWNPLPPSSPRPTSQAASRRSWQRAPSAGSLRASGSSIPSCPTYP